MPEGSYTDPDNLYIPYPGERSTAARVNTNWQTLQDVIDELRGVGPPGRAYFDAVALGADPTGVQDSYPGIQAAINAAAAYSPLAEVFIPAGLYHYSTPPVVSTPNMHVRGAGWGATVLKPQAAIPALRLTTNASQTVVSDLKIDGSASNGTTPLATSGVQLGAAILAEFHRVWVTLCNGHGFYADDTGSVNYARFVGCRSDYNVGSGIRAVGAGANCNNLEVWGGRYDHNLYGIDWQGTENKMWGGHLASNTLFGMRLQASHGGWCHGTIVEANGIAATTWAATTAYALGARIHPSDTSTNPYTYANLAGAGTSAGTEPTWSSAAAVGQTVVDGSVTWTNVGTATEGNNLGAGIDDRGAFGFQQWRDYQTIQGLLRTDSNLDISVVNSGVGGTAALRVLTGKTGTGRTNGIDIGGSSSTAASLGVAGAAADADLRLLVAGAGVLYLGPSSTSPKIAPRATSPVASLAAGPGSRVLNTGGAAGVPAYYDKLANTNTAGWAPGPAVVALTDAATVAVDAGLGTHFTLSTAAGRTIGVPTNPVSGMSLVLDISNTAGSPITLVMSSGTWKQPAAPTIGAGKRQTARFDYDGSVWCIVGVWSGDI